MYDSITFHLEENQFEIKNDRFFDGKKTNQINGRFDTHSSFVSGIREQMEKNKNYYPSISLVNRTIGSYKTGKKKVKRLEIQTSLQKTCYETSKFEIEPNDYDFIFKRTNEYLKMAGIFTDCENLKIGILSSVAFSKSIILPSYFGIAKQVIRKLAPFDYKPRCEFRHREYGDEAEGISIKLFNPIRGFGAYCKYSEILNNGYTLVEEEIKNQVLAGTQSKNIIRIELTLQTKQSLEAVLRRFILTKKKDFTLNDIFTNNDISQKLLLEQFNEVFNPINTALITLSEMKENNLEYLLRSKEIVFKDRAQMSYLVNMTTKIGLSETLKQMKQELSSSSFDRINKELRKTIKELGEIEGNTPNLLEFLRGELIKFEPIKPVAPKTSCQLLLNDI